MTDTPEPVAWLYEIPGANHRYVYALRRAGFADGWTETPLYALPTRPADDLVRQLVEALELCMEALNVEGVCGAECDSCLANRQLIDAARAAGYGGDHG